MEEIVQREALQGDKLGIGKNRGAHWRRPGSRRGSSAEHGWDEFPNVL